MPKSKRNQRSNNASGYIGVYMSGKRYCAQIWDTGKKQYLELEFGKETVTAMRTIKAALDPTNILNPDKVV